MGHRVQRNADGSVAALRPKPRPEFRDPDVQQAIFTRYAEGGANAAHYRNEIVLANIGLVARIARNPSFHGRGLEYNDLVQEGCIGVIRALKSFDHTRGIRFSTYASWWIRQSIITACEMQGHSGLPVRIPHSAKEIHQIIEWEQKRLRKKLGREPTDEEIAETLRDPKAKVNLTRERRRVERARLRTLISTIELDAPRRNDNGENARFGDILADDRVQSAERILVADELLSRCADAFGADRPREREVITRRFGIGRIPETLQEIADEWGLSRERIRQIETRALRILRESHDITANEIKDAVATLYPDRL